MIVEGRECKQLVTPCILSINFDQHGYINVCEWHVSGLNEGYTRTRRFEGEHEFLKWITDWMN